MSNVDTENAENSHKKQDTGSAEPAGKWNLADLDKIPTPKAGAKPAPVAAAKPVQSAPAAAQPQPAARPAPVAQPQPTPVQPQPTINQSPASSPASFNPNDLDQIGRPQPVGYVETNWSSDIKPQAAGGSGILIGVTCLLLIIGFLISQAVNNAAKDPNLKQKLESIEKAKANSTTQHP